VDVYIHVRKGPPVPIGEAGWVPTGMDDVERIEDLLLPGPEL
jgi:hypothetical protein